MGSRPSFVSRAVGVGSRDDDAGGRRGEREPIGVAAAVGELRGQIGERGAGGGDFRSGLVILAAELFEILEPQAGELVFAGESRELDLDFGIRRAWRSCRCAATCLPAGSAVRSVPSTVA